MTPSTNLSAVRVLLRNQSKHRWYCHECFNKDPEINGGRGARPISWIPDVADEKKFKCCSCGRDCIVVPED